MRRLLVTLLALAAGAARGDVVLKPLPATDAAGKHDNVWACEATGGGKRPVVLLAHDAGPTSPAAKAKATQFARLGYAVLSVDWNARDRTRQRLDAALALAGQQPTADATRVAAVGYGAGGTAVLDWARGGADLDAVIVVDGNLAKQGDGPSKIAAPLFAVVGSDAPLAAVAALEDELRAGPVEHAILRAGGAADAALERRAAAAVQAHLTDWLPPKVVRATAPSPSPSPSPSVKAAPAAGPKLPAGVPAKVAAVLKHVDATGEALDGYVGGRAFLNAEKNLPQRDRAGKAVRYREWDVNPHTPGVNRGAERLVTGSDGSAHFTGDHYRTFTKIR